VDRSWAVRRALGVECPVAGCRDRKGGGPSDGSRLAGAPPMVAEVEKGSEMGLNKRDYGSLSLWPADCAEHVLPCFEERPRDDRPRNAVEAGRAWARGEIAMGEARAAAFAAHAAACVAGHAAHAADYAVKAATEAAVPTDSAAATAKERDWQYRRLPEHLRPVAFPARGSN
jgi:hypothetical protein